MKPYSITPIPLGALEYRAQNNYWIPQNYYYQMGGVFLSRTRGTFHTSLPPEISFTNDSVNDLVSVNINALSFNPDNRGLIGGNSPVQIKTKLESIYPIPYAPGDEITGIPNVSGLVSTRAIPRQMPCGRTILTVLRGLLDCLRVNILLAR